MKDILDNEKKILKELIQKELLEEPKSISSIARSLAQKGINIHRLTLTGYLSALADLGFLEEKTILPSKVYSLVKGAEKDIYSDLRKVIDRHIFGEDKIRIAIFALQSIFSRPVFLEELRRMDLEVTLAKIPPDIQRVVGNARLLAKKKAEEFQRLELPQNDPAFEIIDFKDYKEYDWKEYNGYNDGKDWNKKDWNQKIENIYIELLRYSYGVKIEYISHSQSTKNGKKSDAKSKKRKEPRREIDRREIDTLDNFI